VHRGGIHAMPVVQIEHDPQAAADHHQDQESGKEQGH